MATNPYEDVIRELTRGGQVQRQSQSQASRGQGVQAYINYMRGQKSLGEGLARQGITGGASESAMLGAGVGYQNALNQIAQNRAQALADISRGTTANLLTAQAQSADWQRAEQAREEQRFANTITGYDSVEAVDNAIEAATASGDLWKIPYLRAQRAALRERNAVSSMTAESTATVSPLVQNAIDSNRTYLGRAGRTAPTSTEPTTLPRYSNEYPLMGMQVR